MMRWTIRTKLMVIFPLLTVLPILLLGFATYRAAQRALERRIGQDLREQAARTMDVIDRMLFERYQNLKAWSVDQRLAGMLTNDADGQIARFLESGKRQYGLYADIVCADRDGIVVAASRPTLVGKRVSEAPWFQRGLEGETVQDLGLIDLIGSYGIVFAAPIRVSSDAAPIGVLGAVLNWSEVLNLVNTITIAGKTTHDEFVYAIALDREGRAITQPYFDPRDMLLQKNLKAEGLQAATRAVAGQSGFFIERGLYGAADLIGFASSQGHRDFHGLGWSLLVFERTTEAFRPVQALRAQVLLIGLLSCVIVIVVAALVGQSIIAPIGALMRTTATIARDGNLSQRAQIRSRDEIGALAAAFNQMLADLERFQSERKEAEQLRMYASQLQQINKELDDFTYIVSHDLKEPLRSIDAFSRFLEEGLRDQLDDESRMYLDRVRANAKRMQALIEDLLQVSRLSKRTNQLETVRISELLDEVTARFEHIVQERHVEIVVHDALPTMLCDRVRLAEVFANLISNAIKYNDKPTCRIDIRYRSTNGDHEFAVHDNGPGIDRQYFQKIFEIFQRLGKREDQEGTGVGLTIVKKVVELHHGRIWVDSTIGEGTTFFFTVPKDEQAIRGRKKIGEILVEKQVVSQQTIDNALHDQQQGHAGNHA